MTGVAKKRAQPSFHQRKRTESGNILVKLLRALHNTQTFSPESTAFIPGIQVLFSGEKGGDRQSFLSYLLQDRRTVSLYILGPTYRVLELI